MVILANIEKPKGGSKFPTSVLNGFQISGQHRQINLHLSTPNQRSVVIWEAGFTRGKSVDICGHPGVCANLFCLLSVD